MRILEVSSQRMIVVSLNSNICHLFHLQTFLTQDVRLKDKRNFVWTTICILAETRKQTVCMCKISGWMMTHKLTFQFNIIILYNIVVILIHTSTYLCKFSIDINIHGKHHVSIDIQQTYTHNDYDHVCVDSAIFRMFLACNSKGISIIAPRNVKAPWNKTK